MNRSHVTKTCVALIGHLCFISLSTATPPLPENASVQQTIDHFIELRLTEAGISPVEAASEQSLLRRTTLDLAGRIPTWAEQQWYAGLPMDTRRSQLVDRLMTLPDFDLQQQDTLAAMLLPGDPWNSEFRSYLLWAIQQRRPWDRMFRDMIEAKDDDSALKGAAQFLKSRISEVDDLTNDTSVLFFGVNVSCAKCHDHPLVTDWKQDHFYGMQSFFSRTYKTKKNLIAEKPYGEVKFKTTTGEERIAALTFLTNVVVEDRTPEYTDEQRKEFDTRIKQLQQDDKAQELLVPEFSSREALIDAALRPAEESYIARNIVNRIWARMLGTGLVDPLDQMHSGNPPSHPDLLHWLAADLIRHEYDLRRLIQGIALSATYGRSSEWASGDQPPDRYRFAMAETRPLSPRQLVTSLLISARKPDEWAAMESAEEWTKQREELDRQADGWVREFEQPGDGFQVAVDEALFFSNNSRVDTDLLNDAANRLVGHLMTIKDPTERTRILWNTVLCRDPDAEELRASRECYLRSENDLNQNVRILVWALFAGPEFRFNH